jgi:hexosaminidase
MRINSMVNQIAFLFDNQNTLYARPKEISVGADEVNAKAWTDDSSCQGDWANLTALQKSQKFLQMLASNNSTFLFSGWQQMVQSDGNALGNSVVPPNQTGHVYVWNTADNGIAQAATLAQAGYPVVLSFSDETYFDLAYTPDIHEPGFTWATLFSDTDAALSSALSATRVMNQISNPAQQKNILGIEGDLWSENLPSYHHLIYMAIPKMAGLSEASWSPQSKTVANNQVDWQSLATRLGCGNRGFLDYLHQLFDVTYRGYPAGIGLEVPEGACQG